MPRPPANPTIAPGVLPVIVGGLADSGLDMVRLAGQCPLVGQPLPGALELRRFVDFLETVGRVAGDRFFVWRFGFRHAPMLLHTQFPHAAEGATLGEVLRRLADGLRGIQTETDVRFEVERGIAVFAYRVLDPSIWPRCRDAEFTLGFVAGVVRFALGRDVPLSGVRFEHDAQTAGGRLDALVCTTCVYCQCTNTLALPAMLLERRVDCAPPLGCQGNGVLAAGAGEPVGIADRVRLSILRRIGFEAIDQAAIAHDCGVSVRTLRRWLHEQGSDYRELIDQIRMRYAVAMLRGTSLPVHEIAQRLDYENMSAFARAFRRRVGISPTAARSVNQERPLLWVDTSASCARTRTAGPSRRWPGPTG